MKNIPLLLLIVVTMAGCTKNPTACFSGNEGDYVAKFPITFSSCATEAKTVRWEFGDGTSTESTGEVTHTYQQPGTYTVTMTAINGKSEDIISKTVTVRKQTATRVTVIAIPDSQRNGQPWDTGSAADLLLAFSKDTIGPTKYQQRQFLGENTVLPITVTTNMPFDLDYTYHVALLEIDDSTEQYVGGPQFDPYSITPGDEVEMERNGVKVKVKF